MRLHIIRETNLVNFWATTVGNEEELINMLINMNNNKDPSGSKEHWDPSKSVRELKKLECTINYNGQGGGKVIGGDRGSLLLKLK